MDHDEKVSRFLAILLENHTRFFADCTEYMANQKDVNIQARFERDHPAIKRVVDDYTRKGQTTYISTALFAYAVAETIVDLHEYLHQ
jgi:hypothetical protein